MLVVIGVAVRVRRLCVVQIPSGKCPRPGEGRKVFVVGVAVVAVEQAVGIVERGEVALVVMHIEAANQVVVATRPAAGAHRADNACSFHVAAFVALARRVVD